MAETEHWMAPMDTIDDLPSSGDWRQRAQRRGEQLDEVDKALDRVAFLEAQLAGAVSAWEPVREAFARYERAVTDESRTSARADLVGAVRVALADERGQ